MSNLTSEHTLDTDLSVHEPDVREHTADDRRAFSDAVGALRTGGGSLNLSERTLMVLGGVIAPLGLLFVVLGWVGASRTPNTFEQIPYLISGGLLGLSLVFLGAFFYFAHWITELVKEQRASSAALVEAIERLQGRLDQSSVGAGAPPSGAASNGRLTLVATARGSMAHRPDCVAVAGKGDVRAVDRHEGLAGCKLCEPYAEDVSEPA